MQSNHNESETQRAHERDLGTVGGGKIPGAGNKTHHGQVNTDEADNESVANSSYDSGTAAPAAKGDLNDNSPHATPGGGDTTLPSEQGTLGGRNPGQVSTTIGDQDKTFGHRSMDDKPADPMTSRAPDKVTKQVDYEREKQEILEKQGNDH